MSVTETDFLRLSRRVKTIEQLPGMGEISLSEVGAITLWPMSAAPEGWLVCDGSAVLRTAYGDLFRKLCEYKGDATISTGTPADLMLAGHGFLDGDSVYLITTGTLPAGLSANTLYYIRDVNGDTFRLSATKGGPAIGAGGPQSGTHSVYACPWGIDDAGTFNLPNLSGKVAVGKDAGDSSFDNLGETGGEKAHALTEAENGTHTHIQSPHTHTQNTHTHTQDSHSHGKGSLDAVIGDATAIASVVRSAYGTAGGNINIVLGAQEGTHSHSGSISGSTGSTTAANNNTTATNQNTTSTNQNSGSGSAHNNLQPYVVLNFIIRYQSYAAPKKGDKGDKGEKGDTGLAGQAAPYVQAQYSADGIGWHHYYAESDDYIRFSVDGGSVWGESINIRGRQGEQGTQGEQGIQGVQGEQGIQGIQGERGVQGAQGETGVSYRMCGEFDSGITYVNDSEFIDCVTYYGSSYYARQTTAGNLPTDAGFWGVLASKGLDGLGAGDVIGPASNTDGRFPQWNGSGTKSLKDGYSLSDLMLAMYPVGAVYISVVDTSPQTLFGGTWVPIARGRTLAGYDAADADFDTAEETGGEKAHTLSESEIPQHTHGQSSHSHSIAHGHGTVASGEQSNNHSHGISFNAQNGGSHSHHIQWYQGEYISLSGNGSGDSSSGYRTGYTSGSVYNNAVMAATAGSHNHLVSGDTDSASAGHTHSVDIPDFAGDSGASTAVNGDTGGGGAHNNMPPYMVVYMWKRTA